MKYLNKINTLALFIYYFLIPLTQAPGWCIRYYAAKDQFYN